ncbi:MAG: hypothetical protein HYS13_12525 [Planctomycetia bacterium]|nr:hypothetical protein [Planctomycetia bacterium]
MFVRCAAAMALLAGLPAVVGCGNAPEMASVEGTLKLDGKPLDKIQVEFWPESDGPRSMGVTDDKGHFVLTSDDGKTPGAAVGSHKVVLRDVGVLGDKFLGRAGEDVDMTEGRTPRLSSDYGDSQKTPLTKEVTSGKCVIELNLTSPTP